MFRLFIINKNEACVYDDIEYVYIYREDEVSASIFHNHIRK